jgi:ATP-dependent helicase/nuclease subunit B
VKLHHAQLVVGPAASGKTAAALSRALSLAQAGERVMVLTLPGQRAQWLERLANAGSSLGVEVTNLQNIAYRILDRLGENRPIVLNPGRVALTARVLEKILGRNVNPGEARLYARAIAEYKRNLVAPPESEDVYQKILFRAFNAYRSELEIGVLQDLDDVRIRTARLLETNPQALNAHLIVDGYRSFNPSELRILSVLSSLSESSFVTLPAGAPDSFNEAWAHPLRKLELEAVACALDAKVSYLNAKGKPWAGMPKNVRLQTYANPVEEARGTLREIKQLLQSSAATAQDICILVPHPAIARVLEALGREYGVPVAPETSGSILETPNGRQLEALLRAPARDYPARDLRTLAALEPDLLVLAEKLEQNGIAAGSEAYTLVCNDPDALAAFERIVTIAQPPPRGSSQALIAWFERLLQRHFKDASFMETSQVIAREAARILGQESQIEGGVFTDWVQSLLGSVTVPHDDLGRGVAILSAEEASGRRYKACFVMGATDGSYKTGDGEDFFVPEQERTALEDLLKKPEPANMIPDLTFELKNIQVQIQDLDIDDTTAPKPEEHSTPRLGFRLVGLEDSQLYDAFTRADELLVVSHARAERGSSLRPHPRLAQLEVSKQNVIFPTASPLELAALNASPRSQREAVFNVSVRVARKATELERVAVCALRAWAQGLIPEPERGTGLVSGDLLESWARAQRNNLWHNKGKDLSEVVPETHRATLENLAPKFLAQLERTVLENVPNRPDVSQIQLGFKTVIDDLEFILDGVKIKADPGGQVRLVEIYRVVKNLDDAYDEYMSDTRHREWWYANFWLEQHVPVVLWAWDLNNAPKKVMGFDKPYAQRRLEQAMKALESANQTLQSGNVTASSGFHCRYCAYRDVCREAI